jgi:sigma-B regulation protein RsbU (phosphoserine phosphatase)
MTQPLRIAVADDEQDMRDYFTRILPRLGHQVVGAASSGDDLVELCRATHPDLVITDIRMPDTDGIEAAKRICAEQPVPVILVSASNDPALIRRAEADHIMGYLVKPITQADLGPAIALATWRQRMEMELRVAKAATERAYERMRRDVQVAANLQRALLPTNLPLVHGIELGWEYRPCAQLAGDGLNVFWLDDDHLGLYLLDVSGHGVAAALLSVTLARLLSPLLNQSTLLRVPVAGEKGYHLVPPAQVATRLNEWLLANPAGDRFFTMFYGILDVRSHRLRYVSAGHPDPVLAPSVGDPTPLHIPGFPIGCLANADYEDAELPLRPGDKLFLYSDGVTDAANAAKEPFGLARLSQAIQKHRGDPVQQCCKRILAEVLAWSSDSPKDDLSILTVAIE